MTEQLQMPVILANAGIPMIIPQVLLMGLALIPVALVEAAIIRCSFSFPWKRLLKDVAVANLWTMIVGVPLAWGVMLLIQIGSSSFFYPELANASLTRMFFVAVYESAWLWPHMEHLFWLAPLASMILLLPSFVISFLLEKYILVRRWNEIEKVRISRAVFRANVWSYTGLLIAWNGWFLSEICAKN